MKRSYLKRSEFKRQTERIVRRRRALVAHAKDEAGRFKQKPGSRVDKKCPICGSDFWCWAMRSTKTCSRKCMGQLRSQGKREDRQCRHCGKSFSFRLSALKGDQRRGRYCSMECCRKAKVQRHEAMGASPRYKNEAHLIGDKLWKRAVRERDNYTCQRCGKYQLYIHAHHVAPRSRRPDLIRVIENGKCLCASCHTWVHMHPKEATALGFLSDETYERARKEKLVCTVCGDRHMGLGFCKKHYGRFKKYGDPLLTKPKGGPPSMRNQVIRVDVTR